jgi:GntR family transcriptional regulator
MTIDLPSKLETESADSLVKEPVYYQLNRRLRELVLLGKYKEGDQFITEREISQRFGVSRATANKALSNLVSEDLLEFKKGIGTFVRKPVSLDYDLSSLVSFTEKAEAGGKLPQTKVLKLELLAAGEKKEAATRLNIQNPKEKIYYVERLRIADGVPVIFERRYIVAHFCPRLDKTMLEGSLYELLTEHYKLQVDGANQTIRAVTAQKEEARLLDVSVNTACLLISSIGCVSNGVPLWFEETLYRGDSYQFRNRLGSMGKGVRSNVAMVSVEPAQSGVIQNVRRERKNEK